MLEANNELEIINQNLVQMNRKSSSVLLFLNNQSILERMSYEEEDKEELEKTIAILMDVVNTVRNEGYLSLKKYVGKIRNPIFNHIVNLLSQGIDSIDLIIESLLPYLFASNLRGKEFIESIQILTCIYNVIYGLQPIVIKYQLYGYLGILPE